MCDLLRPCNTYRTGSKYWFFVPEFPSLVQASFRATGAGSMFSEVPYLVLLR